jgi:hypothetical protein
MPAPDFEPLLAYGVILEIQSPQDGLYFLTLAVVAAASLDLHSFKGLSGGGQSQQQVCHHALHLAHEVPNEVSRRAERRIDLRDLARVREEVCGTLIP